MSLVNLIGFYNDRCGDGQGGLWRRGHGIRSVTGERRLEDAWARCGLEARAAFGSDALYVEELIAAARHIKIQVIGDGSGAVAVMQLGERDCTIQRRH